MTTQPIPFQASGALQMPPPPRPPGPLPIMAEIEWLRDAVESGQRTIKRLLENYAALEAKLEAEGFTPGGVPTLGPPVAYAIGAVIPAGTYVATVAGSLTVTPNLGVQFTLPAGTNSAQTTISLMPVS